MACASTTFEVQDVKPSETREQQLTNRQLKEAWATFGGEVEAHSPVPPNTIQVFSKNNLLASAVHTAFYDHYPLTLSPDVVWVTLCQGLANHVNHNSRKLRKKFVTHEGKEEITVHREEFSKGNPKNDWPGVFPEFAEKIGERTVGDVKNLVEADFSTTNQISRICSQITLMDVVKTYFEFQMSGGCGIPYITLTGTPEDWENIRDRAKKFEQYDLEWWTKELVPVLDKFVFAAHGNPDRKFFQSICNLSGGSGSRLPITGWIQTLFPYTMGAVEVRFGVKSANSLPMKRNVKLGGWREAYKNDCVDALRGRGEGCARGTPLRHIPSGISSVPFVFSDLRMSKAFAMIFRGGLVAVTQDPKTGELEPRFGWAVLENPSPQGTPKSKNKRKRLNDQEEECDGSDRVHSMATRSMMSKKTKKST